MLLAALVTIALAQPATPLPTPSEEALRAFASRFVGAIARDDADELLDLTEGRDLSTPAMWPAREAIERYDSVAVRAHRVVFADPAAVIVDIELDAVGRTANAHATAEPLPREWRLHLTPSANGWSIRKAETQEMLSAIALATAKDSAAARVAFRNLFPTPRRMIEALGEISVTRREDGPAVAQWLYELALDLNDGYAQTVALVALSRSARIAGDGARSVAYAEAALIAAERSGSCDAWALAYSAAGNRYWETLRRDEGIAYLLRAGALVDRIDDPRVAMKAMRNAAYFLRLVSRHRDEVRVLEELDAAGERYKWREAQATSSLTRGNLWWTLGDEQTAIAEHARAYELFLEAGNPAWAGYVGYHTALWHIARGEYAAAAKTAEDFVRVDNGSDTTLTSTLWSTIAQARTKLGQLDEAHDALRNALFPRGRVVDAARRIAYTALAEVALAADLPEHALAAAAHGIAANDDAADLWPALHASAKALRRMQCEADAIAALYETVKAIEADREKLPLGSSRLRFFATRTAPYLDLIDLLERAGRRHEAFAVAEQVRARTLRDAILLARQRGEGDEPGAVEDEEAVLEHRIAALRRKVAKSGGKPSPETRAALTAARAEVGRLRILREIDAEHPTISGRAPQALNVAAGTVLVEYVVHPDRTIVFVVSRGRNGDARIETRDIPISATRLRAKVRDFSERIERRNLRYKAEARELYQLLLRPVETLIADARLVYLSPDDELWRLPFQALLRADGQFVVERHTIAYVPSLAILQLAAETREAPPVVPRLVAFASTNGGSVTDGTLTPLPHAEVEVREIAKLYGEQWSEVYAGRDARETTLKARMPAATTIHIAGHGIVDTRAPMFSSLLLGDTRHDDGDDGMLEVRELASLRLRANIIVLSACDTGNGAIGSGEGLIGMSWAILAAGCPTAVVSQTKASSASAAELMIEFHRRLRQGSPTAAALRKAAIAIKRQPRYAHPFYWANFMMVGVPE